MVDDTNATSYTTDQLRARVSQLQGALDSRVIIEQAKGVLAERHGIKVDDAFEVLRAYCRSRRIDIHAVAHDVVAGRLDLDVPGG